MHNNYKKKWKLNKYNKYKNNYTVFMHLFDVPFRKMLMKNTLFRLILVIQSEMNYNFATHNENLMSI